MDFEKKAECFNTLIVITAKDFIRLENLYPRLYENIGYGELCFVSGKELEKILKDNANLNGKVKFINENELLSFDLVHSCMTKHLESILAGRELPRGVTGWYYQQFLKMQYALLCEEKYYMVWDGDTIPCKKLNMFHAESGKPYFDMKHEYHAEYFETMGVLLPGFRKVIERSFISEHMLIRTDIMRNLIADIEKNESISGERFWEKIINAIPPEKIQSSAFSEFETYGTYVALKYQDAYKLREWHSFRQAGSFYSIDTISDRDFNWLSKDFDAVSFEKGHYVRSDNANLFDNPYYQEKLTPKQMLQAAQKEYKEGYKEVWADDEKAQEANRSEGVFKTTEKDSIDECKNGVLIVIVSYNSIHLMQECLKSIRESLKSIKYKVVVTDNASTDGVAEWLRKQEDIILIENKDNIGFGPACNQAVEITKGTEFEGFDVYLLNNDTRLPERALENLIKALYSDESIGAAGSVSNYAGNRQELDIDFSSVRDYLAYGEKINYEEPEYEERVRLSGFSMLVKRSVWETVGGFDEDFAPGYFEDDALSVEIQKQGYKLLLVKNSFVYHAGSQSFSKTDYKKLLLSHHKHFIQKYGFDILNYAYADGAMVEQIPYATGDSFVLLEVGAGLGAGLKAIRTRFPNAFLYGIETDLRLRELAEKTERICADIEEISGVLKEQKIDILVMEEHTKNKLDRKELDKLVSLCDPNALLYYKTHKYDEFEYDKIKIVIWDMDDTFWKGIISEGEVLVPYLNVELLTCLTDHGIINSISSKNDEDVVMEELAADGIASLFVFNNINWNEKGQQLAGKLKIMGLRPENALFIDDNPRNLEEVRFASEGIMTAEPDIIPYLLAYFKAKTPKDPKHTRLEQYKLLERKTQARAQSATDSQFLYESEINITINKDCLQELDRIHELISRSNQLNFTKKRDSKDMLARLINNDWNESGYVRARDKYGDYGIIGFYCYNNREKKLEHFVYSCRVMGMGIEQYVYNKLGCPDFEVKEPVSVKLEKNKTVDWITEDYRYEVNEKNATNTMIRVLLKGPCDMSAIEPYLAGGSITTEFNFVNDKGFVTTGQNHSMHIWERGHLSDAQIEAITEEVPFITVGDFETKLFSQEYNVICYSLLQDISGGLYKKKGEDLYINFSSKNFNLTDPLFKERFISGEIQNHAFNFTSEIIDRFAQNWEFVGNTPVDLLLRNLEYIYEKAPGNPTIILLLGSEVEYQGENEEFADLVGYYREINPIIRSFAMEHRRMRVVNVSDFIRSQSDFQDCINHFSRDVYYNIAGEISRYINEKVDAIVSTDSGDKKISFIICVNNEQYMSECRYYIDRLIVPDGYSTDIIEIREAESMTSAYNAAMDSSDAKYKIYLHQDVFLINRNMLFDMLEIFDDPSIGMIGTLGGELSKDADIHSFWNKGATLNATYLDVFEYRFDQDSKYHLVEGIDGMFMATQYDIRWDERLTGWHMYDVSQSVRFTDAGYKICVSTGEFPWTLHDSGFCSTEHYDDFRKKICELYPERFIYTDVSTKREPIDSDEYFKKQLFEEIVSAETANYGNSKLAGLDTEEFFAIYCNVKFLLRRMEFGMPKNDWKELIDAINGGNITLSFLFAAINHSTRMPEQLASEIANMFDKDTTEVFFDQYQRYHTVADIFRLCERFSDDAEDTILEVGANSNLNLEKEITDHVIYYSDLTVPENRRMDNRYFAADATDLKGVKDNAFGYCISCDVFEHIPAERRKAFVSELYRVCQKAVIMCFPNKNYEVEEAEKRANNLYLEAFGKPNPWLIEHIENGLPDRVKLENYLDAHNITYEVFTHGEIKLWERMNYLCSYIDNDEIRQIISDANFEYNREHYSKDIGQNNYRAFYILKKDMRLRTEIDFFRYLFDFSLCEDENMSFTETAYEAVQRWKRDNR